jgi:hypothetical protein
MSPRGSYERPSVVHNPVATRGWKWGRGLYHTYATSIYNTLEGPAPHTDVRQTKSKRTVENQNLERMKQLHPESEWLAQSSEHRREGAGERPIGLRPAR